jgi:hypothetical protein
LKGELEVTVLKPSRPRLSTPFAGDFSMCHPYEEVLTKERADELLPQVIEKIQDYDSVLFYRGGAGKEYFNLIKTACDFAGKTLTSLGYRNLGDINHISRLLDLVEQKTTM